MTKIRDIIQEFIPCEVCGNRDISNFYFHVYVYKGSQPFVKCLECEEEYYSTTAKATMTKAIDIYKKNLATEKIFQRNPLIDDGYRRPNDEIHPIVKTLRGL